MFLLKSPLDTADCQAVTKPEPDVLSKPSRLFVKQILEPNICFLNLIGMQMQRQGSICA